MIGGKGNNRNQMYLAGLQAQSSVYGATIPVYYGTTRGNLLQTWLANLRQGASSKKGKKKGIQTFVENTDFLIGTNPIAGILQVWNNNAVSPLLFKKLSSVTPHYPFAWVNLTYTITDADFYFVIAVTANVAQSGSFNDYGGQGTVAYSGTYELPLWNYNYAGPNPANQNGYRQYPAVYQWIPYSGNVINLPGFEFGNPTGWDGTINVYYAALNPAERFSKTTGGSDVPLANNRLSFEPQLGDGTEYTDDGADKADQQIIYPEYAGVGSSNLDLGAAGVAPAILPEVVGMFPVWGPNGDADPSDMIEDIFMSGPAQAGTGAATAYGDIHHGLGCLDYPGNIQKKYFNGGVEPWSGEIIFDLPNTAGNYLFCWIIQGGGSGSLSLTDDAGNTWIPVFPGSPDNVQLFYCISNGVNAVEGQGATISIADYKADQEIILLEIAGLDTLDGAILYANGTAGIYTQSITTTNNPGEDSVVLSFAATQPGTGSVSSAPFHWERVADDSRAGLANIQVDQYRSKFPGTRTVSYNFGVGGAQWYTVLLAFKNSQPNSFTSPLGNIIDDTTMQQTRLQTRAYGLSGSLFMGSQKKASEWLEELYNLGNAAPVWAGFDLQSIPYAEQSFAGNGAVYVSPTASGPVLNITENDFAPGNGTDPPVTITRKAQVDTPNLQQIQFPNRASNYDQSVICEPDNGSMSLYGTRKDSPKTYASVQTSLVARMLLGIMIRETNIVRNSYKLKLMANKAVLLLPMDLITIPIQSTMPTINQNQPLSGTIALRVLSVDIAEDYTGDVECEPFIYGLRTPLPLTTGSANPNTPEFGAGAGNINTPIIFEAVPQLGEITNLNELWFVVSAPSSNYGGCIANISTDGGSSYVPLGPNGGVIQGNATTGVNVNDWPAAADPDTTNNLELDLTESLGSLNSYQVADEDNLVYPCYEQGGTTGSPQPSVLCAETFGPWGPDAPGISGPTVCGVLTAASTFLTINAPMGNPFLPGDQFYVFIRFAGGNCGIYPMPGVMSSSSSNTVELWNDECPTSLTHIWSGFGAGGGGKVLPAGRIYVANDFTPLAQIGSWSVPGRNGAVTIIAIRGGAGAAAIQKVTGAATPATWTAPDGNTFTQSVTNPWSMFFIELFGASGLSNSPLLLTYITPANTTGWGSLPGGWSVAGGDVTDSIHQIAEAPGITQQLPYELMAYALANLTAPYKYTLEATGGGTNHLRRALYGTPFVSPYEPTLPGYGSDHPIGSRFAFLDPNNSQAPGILRVAMSPAWIGVTLHFKFQSFNSNGSGIQSIASCTDYTYTPTGAPGAVNPNGLPPGIVTVN